MLVTKSPGSKRVGEEVEVDRRAKDTVVRWTGDAHNLVIRVHRAVQHLELDGRRTGCGAIAEKSGGSDPPVPGRRAGPNIDVILARRVHRNPIGNGAEFDNKLRLRTHGRRARGGKIDIGNVAAGIQHRGVDWHVDRRVNICELVGVAISMETALELPMVIVTGVDQAASPFVSVTLAVRS